MARIDSSSRAVSGARVFASAATGLGAFLEANRVCAGSLFDQVALDPERLASPTAPIGLRQYCDILELAARRSHDPTVGLRYGQQFKPEMLGLIGHIALSSPTLRAAAENLAAYFGYHQEDTVTRLVDANGTCRLTYAIRSPHIAERRQDAVVTLGMYVNVFRHGAGPDWCPQEVHLEHARTEDWRAIEEAFGAPVLFGQDANALVFRHDQAARAMPDANLPLLDLLCATIVQMGMAGGTPSLEERIRAYVRANLSVRDLSLRHASDALGIPRWTLQRRLAEGNTSFADIVDRLRRDLAEHYLAGTKHPVSEISALLGFSEVSAFTRAFRRWHGVPPRTYRGHTS
ncbi:AraC-like transcriptional regulator QhpR [Methylobacterium aerolatum]|uniref:AraC-like DNA-binding protein n=1 Tax=Methylobacterium aerolatum TaxID=418708 RepID=A0ABU0I270_9HYPH|nr:AraC family transcriptional regulator [Methylobacterium aerolatum]MDQ0448695.1 AraC-like DNA-binding protein [Methylobacterium aerolatum]